ncbi:MAG: glycoside hydrolase 5 family protein [bacterium]
MSEPRRALRYGVNYVPSSTWWYIWQDWNSAGIAADLHAIAEIGLDHIRIQCLWPLFQPDPGYISQASRERFSALLDLADDAGLDVVATVLDGWLSGWAYLPAFVHHPSGMRSIYTDPDIVAAEKALFSALISTAAGHRRFLGLDLGNEINVLEHFVPRPSIAEGDAWAQTLCDHAAALQPDLLLTNGVDHNPWYRDTVFSRRGLARTGTHTSVHAWVKFTGALDLFPAGHIGREAIARYLVELAAAYAEQPSRPVWLQEFGASGAWLPEAAIPELIDSTLHHVEQVPELWGVTWWCSHDIDPNHHGFSAQEYDMGLLDHSNRVKPLGALIRDRIHKRIEPAARTDTGRVALVFDERNFDDAAASYPDRIPETASLRSQTLARAFMQHYTEHPSLCLLHRSRLHDAEYLRLRGITSCIEEDY